MAARRDDIESLLTRGVDRVVSREHLAQQLEGRRKLRVKLGIDPTTPDLHLGHLAVFRKLRQFQDLGHEVIFLVGDFTATIGDPSGRSESRKPLSDNEVTLNMRSYVEQAGKILDRQKLTVRHNSEWFKKANFPFALDLLSRATVSRIIEREDFRERLKDGRDVTMLEAFYSLLQGYDSVALKADVEVGGTDQLLNILAARRIQKRYDQPEEDILTVALLEGTDGVRKMSKSFRNTINFHDEPEDMFGKIMSISDGLIAKYFTLLTAVDETEIKTMSNEIRRKPSDARTAKARLARDVVTQLHSPAAARRAEDEFRRIFSEHETPASIPEVTVPAGRWTLVDLLASTKLAKSRSEAQRLIRQGGVSLDGEVQKDPKATIPVKTGMVVKVGKRRFARLRISKGI